MKVFAYRSALCRLGHKSYVTEGRQTERAHELFMNTYVVAGQRYCYIDNAVVVMVQLLYTTVFQVISFVRM